MELNYDLIQKGMLGCIDSPGYIQDATYDINNLKPGESCYYDASITPVNAPTSGCRVYCIEGYGRPHQGAKFQIAVKYNQLKPYIRHYWSGTWSSWEQIALKGETTSEISSAVFNKLSFARVNVGNANNGFAIQVNSHDGDKHTILITGADNGNKAQCIALMLTYSGTAIGEGFICNMSSSPVTITKTADNIWKVHATKYSRYTVMYDAALLNITTYVL